MVTTASATQLIAALADEAHDQWAAQLEAVEMRLGDVLHEPGCTVGQVYFPTTSIVSLLHHFPQSGASAEVAAVGNEGIVGISAFMGGQSSLNRSVVRSAGSGFRLPVAALVKAFEQGGPVAQHGLLYTQALVRSLGQAGRLFSSRSSAGRDQARGSLQSVWHPSSHRR